MSYISRKYYESIKENPHLIWKYLDCIEKVAYHQFQDMSLDMEEVFCNDINFWLFETDSSLKLRRNDIRPIEQCFEMKWSRNIQKPEEYIKQKIDNGIIVGINTYFYDIPNFTWYKKERNRESVHICMIVGYDEKGFWLTDVPENMKKDYLMDEHITIISYDDMKLYLAKQCNVLTFENIADSFSACKDLHNLITRIIKEYSSPPYSENGRTVWKGKRAYERLMQLIKDEDPRVSKMDFYHGEFVSYIISGRHDILRRNILKKYGSNSETKNVLEWLEICQKKWEILGYKILRENIKKRFCIPKEKDIYDVYESEKVLIKHLQMFCEDNTPRTM